MNVLNVQTKDFSYPIIIENSFDRLKEQFKKNINSKKALIISDSNVEKLYLQEVKEILVKCNIKVYEHIIPAGEESKRIEIITRIYEKCMEYELDRQSCIIALGGGVVGDIAGFAASTFMRGINIIQVPTTLLAQIDSSIGGKTGVDFKGYKNIVGSFHQPSLVYINISTLKTLPKREFISGMAEVIKYGIIADVEFFDFLDNNSEKILNLDNECINEIIFRCCKIKSKIVAQDEREVGIRAILNFGHTIGHAIESASGFKLLHGECVGIGMIAAVKVSKEMGLIVKSEMNKITNVIDKYGLNLKSQVDIQEVMNNLYKDKKVVDNSISMVLVKRIGDVEVCENIDNKIINTVVVKILQ